MEHCRKRNHVHLLYFPTRSGWDSRVSPKLMIYIRNLMLIRKRKFAFTAAAPSQHPREQSDAELQPNNNSLDAIARQLRPHAEAISIFCETVERLAEEKMLKTHKLEGAHYSAMKQLREKIIGERVKRNEGVAGTNKRSRSGRRSPAGKFAAFQSIAMRMRARPLG